MNDSATHHHYDDKVADEKGLDGTVGVYAVEEPIWDDLETTTKGEHGTNRVLVSVAVLWAVKVTNDRKPALYP